MIGEISALVCALCWAVSSTFTKALAGKFHPLGLNLLRCLAGSAFFWALIPLVPGVGSLGEVPLRPLLYLISSALIGIAVGDTIYLKGLRKIQVTLAFPLSQSAMPLITLALAVLFLGERITGPFLAGTALVLLGNYLVIHPRQRAGLQLGGDGAGKAAGISLVLAASALWAVSISLLKIGLEEVDLFLANGIRLPLASLLLIFFFLGSERSSPGVRLRDISLGVLTGVLAFGVGGIFFLLSVQHAGAGKAAVLTSCAPLFGLPFSVLYLKERVERNTVLGTALLVLGIIFLV